MAAIFASAGAVMIGIAVVFVGIAVLIHLGNQIDRRSNPNVRGCSPVCTPTRACNLTGAYIEQYRAEADDRPAYGQGDWQPTTQATGRDVREVSAATPYHGRGDAGKRAPMTAPQHGEEWDYTIPLPQSQPERIPAPNWPVRVKR